jgi:hypothetical protein
MTKKTRNGSGRNKGKGNGNGNGNGTKGEGKDNMCLPITIHSTPVSSLPKGAKGEINAPAEAVAPVVAPAVAPATPAPTAALPEVTDNAPDNEEAERTLIWRAAFVALRKGRWESLLGLLQRAVELSYRFATITHSFLTKREALKFGEVAYSEMSPHQKKMTVVAVDQVIIASKNGLRFERECRLFYRDLKVVYTESLSGGDKSKSVLKLVVFMEDHLSIEKVKYAGSDFELARSYPHKVVEHLHQHIREKDVFAIHHCLGLIRHLSEIRRALEETCVGKCEDSMLSGVLWEERPNGVVDTITDAFQSIGNAAKVTELCNSTRKVLLNPRNVTMFGLTSCLKILFACYGAGVDAEVTTEGYTALCVAGKLCDEELIVYLLGAGADMKKAKDCNLVSPLIHAVLGKKPLKLIRELLKKGASPTDGSKIGSALIIAVRRLKTLIEKAHKVTTSSDTAQGKKIRIPVELLRELDDTLILVGLCLPKRARCPDVDGDSGEPKAKTESGDIVLPNEEEIRKIESESSLFKRIIQGELTNWDHIRDSIQVQNWEMVLRLLGIHKSMADKPQAKEEGFKKHIWCISYAMLPWVLRSTGPPPLTMLKVITFVLDRLGVDVNEPVHSVEVSERGKTPLQICVMDAGHIRTIKHLVSHGADIRLLDCGGHSVCTILTNTILKHFNAFEFIINGGNTGEKYALWDLLALIDEAAAKLGYLQRKQYCATVACHHKGKYSCPNDPQLAYCSQECYNNSCVL